MASQYSRKHLRFQNHNHQHHIYMITTSSTPPPALTTTATTTTTITMIIMMMMMMIMMLVTIIMMKKLMIKPVKGAIRYDLQSPHCGANCLQHEHSSDQGAFVCRSRATHRVLITCNMTCVMWYIGTAQLLHLTRVEIAFIFSFISLTDTISRRRRIENRSARKNTPDDELQKTPHTHPHHPPPMLPTPPPFHPPPPTPPPP